MIHDDFLGFHDGTLYGNLIPGARESLELLSKKYNLVIFSAKAKPSRPLVEGKTGQELIWEWLARHEISSFISEVTAEKPRAFAYIDDKASPILKSNYLLRSLVIPEGTHTIKFEFKPDSYYGNILFAQVCEGVSILLILILLGTWIKSFKTKQG